MCMCAVCMCMCMCMLVRACAWEVRPGISSNLAYLEQRDLHLRPEVIALMLEWVDN